MLITKPEDPLRKMRKQRKCKIYVNELSWRPSAENGNTAKNVRFMLMTCKTWRPSPKNAKTAKNVRFMLMTKPEDPLRKIRKQRKMDDLC